MDELRKYLEAGRNLPDFMKDFHDQKDLFKAIYYLYDDADVLKNVRWTDAHVFTIDIFLWWMGVHGYKLQKIKSKNLRFHNPITTIKNTRQAILHKSFDFLSKTLAK